MITAALKSALRTLGVIAALGVTEAYSSGGGEDFILRPSKGPFTVDSTPPSSEQANATADGVSQAPSEDEKNEEPTYTIDPEQNAGSVRIFLMTDPYDINEIGEDDLTPLTRAAQRGDERQVRFLMERGVDVNRYDGYGSTALHWAAQRGHERLVRLLVQEGGVDVNQRTQFLGLTALHEAAALGQKEIVRMLAQELEADINQRDRVDHTALYWAVFNGREKIVRIFVEELHVDVNQPCADGDFPITLAAICGHENLVFYLHERGAHINQADRNHRTPLAYAVREGELAFVEELTQLGADPHERLPDGASLLEVAIEGGHEVIVRYLLEELKLPFDFENARSHLLFEQAERRLQQAKRRLGEAVAKSNEDSEAYLADESEDTQDAVFYRPNPPDEEDGGFLRDESEAILDTLFRKLNEPDEEGWTALNVAIARDDLATTELILSLGADPHIVGPEGWTPLERAVDNNNREIVRLLRLWEADFDQPDFNDRTALYRAVINGNQRMVRLLIKLGAHPDTADRKGRTVLHQAAYRGEKAILEFLMTRSDNPYRADNRGWTILHWFFRGMQERGYYESADEDLSDEVTQTPPDEL